MRGDYVFVSELHRQWVQVGLFTLPMLFWVDQAILDHQALIVVAYIGHHSEGAGHQDARLVTLAYRHL